MPDLVHIAFERRVSLIPLSSILPLNRLTDSIKDTSKYKRIAKSIAEVGIIEPLIVARSRDQKEKYLLLDGHMRFSALIDSGEQSTRCIIADDDEAFTYNKRVNHLATVQEHFMIARAIERGVSEEKLAEALNVDIKHIKRRRSLLNGVCPEVIELLKDKSVNPIAFEVLRKMKPMRQIDAAELMLSAGSFTTSYAKAILAATKQSDLIKSDQPKKVAGISADQMARMEREMEALQQDFKQVEASYGDDVLHLVIASGYLSKLIGNRAINRYLEKNHSEFLKEFQAIIAATSLDQTQIAAE